jgi:hypothetical protein
MNYPHECRRKAEALATLALMFPESADRYRAKEQHWRDLAAAAQRNARPPAPNPDGGAVALNGSTSGKGTTL